jgi:ABC-type uncharacterized transport system fused permease/ATPase subunit
VPVVVLGGYQRELLALKWREWMVERMLALYLGGGDANSGGSEEGVAGTAATTGAGLAVPAYFAIESGGSLASATTKPLDNPDQRIAEDVRAFTRSSLSFGLTIMRSIIDLFSFAAILYSIYPLLFGVILLYASVGTAATVWLGQQLVALNYQVLQREADLRFSLVRVRENAESIAFYGGEQLERQLVDKRLADLVVTRRDVLRVERNLDFFTTAYQFLIQILPGAVVAPLFFAGKVELGVVSQSFGAFNHILNDFSIIVNQFEALSQFSAGVDRLGEFALRLQLETGAAGVMQLPPGHPGSTATVKARAAAALAAGGAEEDEVPEGAAARARSRARQWPAGTGAASTEVLARAGALVAGGLAARPVEPAQRSAGTANTAAAAAAAAADAAVWDAQASVAEALHGAPAGAGAASSGRIAVRVVPGLAGVWVRGLTLRTPDGGRTLLRGLDLSLQAKPADTAASTRSAAPAVGAPPPSELEPPSRLLVVGPSGSGKSSLLRAIAGLWTAGAGVVERPPSDAMMFLPQRPYCTPGTLRDQLMYPQQQSRAADAGADAGAKAAEDARLLGILDTINLPGLAAKWSPRCRMEADAASNDVCDVSNDVGDVSNGVGDVRKGGLGDAVLGLDAEVDWGSVLSLGEQQRLAFGRLLYNMPRVAVLDEATSALDISSEAAM